ncbi:MAG: hypothetical protein K2G60_01975, partial [Oscillospiraceae bacterium]|nr:hypothetical protein [Oscillospiraceae bacterium]
TPTAQDVTASKVMLLPNETLSVSCEYSGKLLLRENASTTLDYKMQNNSTDFNSGATVLTCSAGTPDAVFSTAIGSILTAAPIFAGVYTDTVTFNCSVA